MSEPGKSHATPIPVGPHKVWLLTEGDRIVLGHTTKKAFEPETLTKWAEMCAGGGTVIDVGAYTGLFTVAARMAGCHVLAFEPLPNNRHRLRANCRLNGVDDAVNSEAVADRLGTASVRSSDIPFTSGASLIRKTGRAWPVDLLTIDSLRLKSVKAIKMDVERAEPLVLRGARETIRRHRPELLIEVLGEKEAEAVTEEIRGLAYRRAAVLDVRNWYLVPAR